jgi:hypothetical protein
MRALALPMLLLLAGCRSSYACHSDADCPGQHCITFKLAPGDEGSSCRTRCPSNCPPGLVCTACPDSPQRCTLPDGGPSGGFCIAPSDPLYPVP